MLKERVIVSLLFVAASLLNGSFSFSNHVCLQLTVGVLVYSFSMNPRQLISFKGSFHSTLCFSVRFVVDLACAIFYEHLLS